jgi:hypothetical protein
MTILADVKLTKSFASNTAFRLLLVFIALTTTLSTSAMGDVSLASGETPTQVPFVLNNYNQIVVPAWINGQGPFLFILDTGAERNIMVTGVAKSLGLKTRGSFHVMGFGPQRIDATQTNNITIRIGDVSLSDQKFVTLDFSKIQAVFGGHTVQGLLGANIFKNFVVRIDYAHRMLSLALPSMAPDHGDGIALPLRFNKASCPRIDGKADGIAGVFNIDTGAEGGLLLYVDFVERNRFLKRFASQLQDTTVLGVGGETRTQTIPVMRLDLGSISMTGPVSLALDQDRMTSSKDAAGTIGEDILSTMTVTFDYSHKRIIFEPPSEAASGTPK